MLYAHRRSGIVWKKSALAVRDYGSAESNFFPFAICALFDGRRVHAYDFVNFLRWIRLQRNACSSHTRFLQNLSNFYCLSLGLTPSHRHTHSNLFIKTNRKIHQKKLCVWCSLLFTVYSYSRYSYGDALHITFAHRKCHTLYCSMRLPISAQYRCCTKFTLNHSACHLFYR